MRSVHRSTAYTEGCHARERQLPGRDSHPLGNGALSPRKTQLAGERPQTVPPAHVRWATACASPSASSGSPPHPRRPLASRRDLSMKNARLRLQIRDHTCHLVLTCLGHAPLQQAPRLAKCERRSRLAGRVSSLSVDHGGGRLSDAGEDAPRPRRPAHRRPPRARGLRHRNGGHRDRGRAGRCWQPDRRGRPGSPSPRT